MAKIHLTTITLENVEEMGLITEWSVYGYGLLTMIVSYFCNLFGIENYMLEHKIEKAKKAAVQRLAQRAKNIDADGVMNIRYEISNQTTLLVYGTAYKCKKQNN